MEGGETKWANKGARALPGSSGGELEVGEGFSCGGGAEGFLCAAFRAEVLTEEP